MDASPKGRTIIYTAMITAPDEIAPVLKSLIETCKDGQEGFRTAAEGIEGDQRLKSFLHSCSEQRGRFVAELEEELRKLGDFSTETPSIASSIHRGWINLKSALTGKDPHSILAECERGEDSALKEYQKALDSGLPVLLDAIVARQRQEIVITHSAVREARDANPAPTVGGLTDTVSTKSRELASSAGDALATAKKSTGDAIQTGAEYVRANPVPVILSAFGIGLLVAVLIRAYQHHEEEQRPVRKVERMLDQAGDAIDIRPYVVPFVWPLVKYVRDRYYDSSKAVTKAYGQSSKSVSKTYKKSANAVSDAVEDAKDIDFEKYGKAAVKKVKSLF